MRLCPTLQSWRAEGAHRYRRRRAWFVDGTSFLGGMSCREEIEG
jgi:hypothetical protein